MRYQMNSQGEEFGPLGERESMLAMARIVERKKNALTTLSSMGYMRRAVGCSKWEKLGVHEEDARALGFRPLPTVWSGWVPLCISEHCFVDASGATVLTVFRTGFVYLTTELSDGTAISHTTRITGGRNLETSYHFMNGLEWAYGDHQEKVRQACRERGVRPIRRDTTDTLLMGFHVFVHARMSRSMIATVMMTNLQLLFFFVFMIRRAVE